MSVNYSPGAAKAPASSDVWEVASGVDALYMSGHVNDPPKAVFEGLQIAREIAIEAEEPVGIDFGGVDLNVEPHGFGRYKYCLSDSFGLIGVSPSEHLPSVRIQPKSEFLHRAGVKEVVEHYRRMVVQAMGNVQLNASRLDLYGDFQGWDSKVDDRHEFVRRASAVSAYEEHDEFNGITFGKRSTNTFYCRIYDKTAEIRKKKDYFVQQVWNEKYDPSLPVIRVEFQIGRKGLRDFGISSVEDALKCVPGFWIGLTEHWLSLRQVTSDTNRSRRPFAPAWTAVHNASLGSGAIGLNRMAADHATADLEALLPGLVGYVSSAAAVTGDRTLLDALSMCEKLIRGYANSKNRTFEEIVARKIGERSFVIPERLK